jgi:hypothetical protein
VVYCCVGGNMSDENLEQRINIKFCVKIGKSASETLALLTVTFGEYAMKKSSIFNGIGDSRKGEKICKMSQEVGRKKTKRTDANVGILRILVRSDRRLGVRLIAEKLNKNREAV